MKRLAIMGREDFDNGYGGQQIVLDVSYGNDSYRLDFEQVEPQYLSGDWVAKQEGRDYETEFGIADYDYNKDEYNRLADKLVEDRVIGYSEDAYQVLKEYTDPYLDKDGLTPEQETTMLKNEAIFDDINACKGFKESDLAEWPEVIKHIGIINDMPSEADFFRILEEHDAAEDTSFTRNELTENTAKYDDRQASLAVYAGIATNVYAAIDWDIVAEKANEMGYIGNETHTEYLSERAETFMEVFNIEDRIDTQVNAACIESFDKDSGYPAESAILDKVLDSDTLRQDLQKEAQESPNAGPVSLSAKERLLDKFENDADFRQEVQIKASDIVEHSLEGTYYSMSEARIEDYCNEFIGTFESVHAERDSINKAIITAYNDAYTDTDDEKILDTFAYRIECAEIRMESDNKAEDLLRNTTGDGLIREVEAIKDGREPTAYGWGEPETASYFKEGHQITDDGVANIKCDETLKTYFEYNEDRSTNRVVNKDLAINSSDISLLKSYNPEAATKLENLKASCYTPVYVEPPKEAPVDHAVAKSKETGISL